MQMQMQMGMRMQMQNTAAANMNMMGCAGYGDNSSGFYVGGGGAQALTWRACGAGGSGSKWTGEDASGEGDAACDASKTVQ